MSMYCFVREDGFYWIDYPDDASAMVGAFDNVGTKQVISLLTRKIVWDTGDSKNVHDLNDLTPQEKSLSTPPNTTS